VSDDPALCESFYFADAAVNGEDDVAKGFGVLERDSGWDGAGPQDFGPSTGED
jgi:hypothetical protein